MPKSSRTYLLLLVLSGSLGGCWVKTEVGNVMQADIAALQVELAVVKKHHSKEKVELNQRIQEADRQVAELVKIIGEYRRATGRNAADVGVDIERLKTQLMEMKGRLEVSEHRLERMEAGISSVRAEVVEQISAAAQEKELSAEASAAAQTKIKADPLQAIERPEKKKDFYKLAYGMLEAGQSKAARTLFSEFLSKWPTDGYSDNAMYWIGESYYAEQDFRLAALTFQKVRTQYPKGDKAKDSLFKLGYCFLAMERYREALPFLQEFVQTYPKSSLVEKARKKIRVAQKKIKKNK